MLTVGNFSFFTYSWSFFAYSSSFLTYNWSFFAYSGKVRLIRALRDCKPRSSTVSKKAPTVSKKASPKKTPLSAALKIKNWDCYLYLPGCFAQPPLCLLLVQDVLGVKRQHMSGGANYPLARNQYISGIKMTGVSKMSLLIL